MKSQTALWKGKSYCYILLLMDIFSQFHWLDPLQRKYPHAAPHLDEFFSVHGPPDRPQSDHGGEFKKEVIKVAKIFLLP